MAGQGRGSCLSQSSPFGRLRAGRPAFAESYGAAENTEINDLSDFFEREKSDKTLSLLAAARFRFSHLET
jgi:hypothetical protein